MNGTSTLRSLSGIIVLRCTPILRKSPTNCYLWYLSNTHSMSFRPSSPKTLTLPSILENCLAMPYTAVPERSSLTRLEISFAYPYSRSATKSCCSKARSWTPIWRSSRRNERDSILSPPMKYKTSIILWILTATNHIPSKWSPPQEMLQQTLRW